MILSIITVSLASSSYGFWKLHVCPNQAGLTRHSISTNGCSLAVNQTFDSVDSHRSPLLLGRQFAFRISEAAYFVSFQTSWKKEVLLPAGQALLGSWHESENPTGQGPTISANCASHAQLQGPVSDVKSFCQKRFQSSGSLLSSKAASRANNKVVERLFPRPRNCQFKPFYPWQLYKYKIIKVYKSTMSELLWN